MSASPAPSAPQRHWTEDFTGFPYAQGGDTTTGFNCWGFFAHVELQRFQVHVPQLTEPEQLSKLLRKVPAAAVALGWEATTEPRSGDAVLMAHLTHPSHVGVYVDDIDGGSVLHCIRGVGSVLHSRRHLMVARWRIIAFYRPVDMPGAGVLEVPGHG